MKLIIALFILITSFGCAGNGKNTDDVSFYDGDDSIMVAKGYSIVPLQKTRTEHITATFKVNGKPCIFLVDTGGGATFIDFSQKDKYSLAEKGKRNYAAGVGAVTSLIETSAIIEINGLELKDEELFLMDISHINAEFIKNKVRPVDGVLGTDFLERHKSIIDYPHSKLYLVIMPDGENQM